MKALRQNRRERWLEGGGKDLLRMQKAQWLEGGGQRMKDTGLGEKPKERNRGQGKKRNSRELWWVLGYSCSRLICLLFFQRLLLFQSFLFLQSLLFFQRLSLLRRLLFFQSLAEVGNDVVDVLYTDGEANGRGSDVLLGQLLGAHLRVSGGVGVDDKTLHVGYVGQK